MLRAVQAPAGQVWLHGAESYLAVARAWLAAGDASRARAVLIPLAAAARAPGVASGPGPGAARGGGHRPGAGRSGGAALAAEAAALAAALGMRRLGDRAAGLTAG